MTADEFAVTTCYLEHLTDDDLAFLHDPHRHSDGNVDYRRLVRARRGGVEGLLGSRDVFEALFMTDKAPAHAGLAVPGLCGDRRTGR